MADNDDLKKAIRYHQEGKVDKAVRIYSRILKSDPDSVDALHFLGVLRYQQGKTDDGAALVRRALELNPGYADAHNNLGNMLKEMGEFDDARASYENALTCDPDRLETHNNLGVLLRHLGDPEGSLHHLTTAVTIAPKWAHAHFNLGNTYAALKRRDDAAKHFRMTIELDSELSRTHAIIGTYLSLIGHADEARALYEKWLDLEPGNPVAEHMLAACTGESTPSRATDKYIVSTFDQFAQSFEFQLEKLNYQAPELIAQAISHHLKEPTSSLNVLDLGCGTGLCGPLVKPYAARLTGVDLSQKMLQKNLQKGCYDKLYCRELVTFLTGTRESYDLMLSADTLVYFGDLQVAFDAMAARLNPGGLLTFTVEQNIESDDDFILYPHGRYGHKRNYLESSLTQAGFCAVKTAACDLRKERGEAVKGWLVTAEKGDVKTNTGT